MNVRFVLFLLIQRHFYVLINKTWLSSLSFYQVKSNDAHFEVYRVFYCKVTLNQTIASIFPLVRLFLSSVSWWINASLYLRFFFVMKYSWKLSSVHVEQHCFCSWQQWTKGKQGPNVGKGDLKKKKLIYLQHGMWRRFKKKKEAATKKATRCLVVFSLCWQRCGSFR